MVALLARQTATISSEVVLRRSLSSNTASIVKVHRSVYARRYPTMVVLPDGATININYHEPRRIVKVSAMGGSSLMRDRNDFFFGCFSFHWT